MAHQLSGERLELARKYFRRMMEISDEIKRLTEPLHKEHSELYWKIRALEEEADNQKNIH